MDTLAILRTLRRHLLSSFLLLVVGLAGPAHAGNVQLAWDANVETDLAGYLVLVGTSSGVYTQSIEVAPTTPQAEVADLPDGATYYFAVRAFNAAGLQSGLSNEVAVTLGPVVLSPPVIAAVSPASGSVAGGTAITITGSNFMAGATVRIGAIIAPVQSLTATSIVVTAPTSVAGEIAVSVTNPDGQVASTASAFTYVASPPIISTVSPASGSVSGGTIVTISGSDFVTGATVRVGATLAAVQSVSATSIVAATPAGAAGVVDVSVTNPDGEVATKNAAFTYVAAKLGIAAVSPASGNVAGGTVVTISGSNFTTGLKVDFGGTVATVQSVSATTIVVTAPARRAGTVDVRVINPDGQIKKKYAAFTYVADAPTLTSFAPTSGPTAGGTVVTLTGAGFTAGAVVRFGATPASVQSVSATSIVVLAPVLEAGPVPVSVTLVDGQSATATATFTALAPAPVVTSVTPASASTSGGTTVDILGSNFVPGASVLFGTQPAEVTAVTPTAITVLTPAQAAASVGVTVVNPDGSQDTRANAFSYEAPAPVLDSLSPANGLEAGGTVVTLSGAHFLAGASVTFGDQVAVVSSVSDTQIVVTTPAHAVGAVDVTVQNPDGLTVTLNQVFTYQAPSPLFVRYFAEGVQSDFFSTRFALANPHAEPVAVRAVFTDSFGDETAMTVDVAAGGHATIDRSTMPVITGEAFATRFESEQAVAVDRTVTWDNTTPYGGHSETGIEAPRTTWYFAEGATDNGSSLFYLLQNPGNETAEVLVRYTLGTGQVVEKVHNVPAHSRTNVWVNQDDPALASADVAAQLRSLNDVPFIVERTMYKTFKPQLFTSGTNNAGVAEPATDWFLAESSSSGSFDTLVLVFNPNPTAATLDVTYLFPEGSPLVRPHTVAANSRISLRLYKQSQRLRSTDVSIKVTSTNGVPVIVERTMWWSDAAGVRTEAHSSAATTAAVSRWVMADGISDSATGAATYAVVANTGALDTQVRFTVLTPEGRGRSVEQRVAASSRFSLDVALMFPEVLDTSFGLLVESVDGAPLVVERSSYWDAGGVPRAGGSNSLAMPLR